MERLTQRMEMAAKALASFEELAQMPERSKLERDAAIQRFDYSFEAVWKAAQLYLRVVEGLEVGSPKGVARVSLQVGLLDEARTRALLLMVDDRNLTVHTYNEALAVAIGARLGTNAMLLRTWLGQIAAGARDAAS